MKNSEAKLLWGQEFRLVKQGLAEEEVVAFVDNLIKQRDKSAQYLQQLAEKTVMEATELAEKIKQEAQGEVTKLTAEANELSEKIKQDAQGEVSKLRVEAEAARKEADKVMAETEEKTRKVMEEAQKQADDVVKEANELSEKIKQDARHETSKLRAEAEAARKDTAKAMAETEEKTRKVMEKAQKQADNVVKEANELSEKIKQDARDDAAKLTAEAKATGEEATRVLEQARQRAGAIIETVRKPILNEIELMRNTLIPALENLSAGIARGGTDAMLKEQFIPRVVEVEGNGRKKSPEAEETLESEFAALVSSDTKTAENAIPVDFVDKLVKMPPLPADDSALFEGELEIAMLPPVDMAQLIQLRRNLLNTPYVKILRTAGSWNEGSVVTVVVDKPLPLLNMLTEMPEVERAVVWSGEEGSDGDFASGLTLEQKPGSNQRKRVIVTLKKN